MKTIFVLIKLYAIGVLLQLTIGLGILINSQAGPFELCPKMQYFERELGKHTMTTCVVWPYFAGQVLYKHYMTEIRFSKTWK